MLLNKNVNVTQSSDASSYFLITFRLGTRKKIIPKDQRNRFYFLVFSQLEKRRKSSFFLMTLLLAFNKLVGPACEGREDVGLVKGSEEKKEISTTIFRPLMKSSRVSFLIHIIKSRVEIKLTISFH